jgi:hypothetical protein
LKKFANENWMPIWIEKKKLKKKLICFNYLIFWMMQYNQESELNLIAVTVFPRK